MGKQQNTFVEALKSIEIKEKVDFLKFLIRNNLNLIIDTKYFPSKKESNPKTGAIKYHPAYTVENCIVISATSFKDEADVREYVTFPWSVMSVEFIVSNLNQTIERFNKRNNTNITLVQISV